MRATHESRGSERILNRRICPNRSDIDNGVWSETVRTSCSRPREKTRKHIKMDNATILGAETMPATSVVIIRSDGNVQT